MFNIFDKCACLVVLRLDDELAVVRSLLGHEGRVERDLTDPRVDPDTRRNLNTNVTDFIFILVSGHYLDGSDDDMVSASVTINVLTILLLVGRFKAKIVREAKIYIEGTLTL